MALWESAVSIYEEYIKCGAPSEIFISDTCREGVEAALLGCPDADVNLLARHAIATPDDGVSASMDHKILLHICIHLLHAIARDTSMPCCTV